jgi:hypothetical protein
MLKSNIRFLRLFNSFLFVSYLVIGVDYPSLAQSQQPNSLVKEKQVPASSDKKVTTQPNSNNSDSSKSSRPLDQSDSILSISGAQKLINDSQDAINNGKYDLAVADLQQARKSLNQISNFHLQLANSFSGIDQNVTESQRSQALKAGQLRDQTTYQLALVHRAQNKPELAVPLLIQVILSQNAASELGRKSYQQLYELGFVEIPYTAGSSSSTPDKR